MRRPAKAMMAMNSRRVDACAGSSLITRADTVSIVWTFWLPRASGMCAQG